MSNELPTILSAENYADTKQTFDDSGGGLPPKKIMIILGILVLVIALVLIFVFRFLVSKTEVIEKEEEQRADEAEVSRPILPILEAPNLNGDLDLATSTDLMIESLSFADFYKKEKIDIRPNFESYELPLNTKIEVINYHDTARKLNLDPFIDDLNNNGFALIDNPWKTEALDFYSAYAKLREEQIPLFISSDFLIYY